MFNNRRISRREFLKLLGTGAATVTFGWFAGGGSLISLFKDWNGDNNGSGGAAQLAYAQSAGSWLPVQSSTSTVAIHVALTRTGKIFYLAGSGWNINNENGPYQARLLDPVTGIDTNVPLSKDLFCAGQCQLPNGNMLFCGGTAIYENDINNCDGRWHGARFAFEFDVTTGTLVERSPMQTGRWYPTLITLPDGRVLVVSGMDDFGSYNYLAEVYDPVSRTWSTSFDPFSANRYCVGQDSTCPGAGAPCFGGPNQGTAPWLSLYPRMFLMPSGLVYTSSQREELFLFDPSTSRWTDVGRSAFGQYRDYGTSILLPLQNSTSERGKVMVLGGSSTDTGPATNVVEIHDFNQGTSTSPNIRTVGPLNFGRKYPLPIILPNGKVVIFGGSAQANENPIFVPEMFDPENESLGWVSLPAATVPRVYHGTALLLPDGSVWTASSTPQIGVSELRIEIFRPSYFFSSTARPTISGAPTVGGYGGTITIPTPNAANIARVSLIKTGCTTHHYDVDMRLIWLPITNRGANSVTVSAPINVNIAPPGYYMIHVLDGSFVPSTAQIIKIPGSTADTIAPTVTITSPSNNAKVSVGKLTVSGTSQDNAGGTGVNNVGVQVDSGPFVTATGTSSWSAVVNVPSKGKHQITARAQDNAGNIGSSTINITGR
jgi:hypothetical protein